MNEAPDPLEAELAALRPHDGSPRLRQRLAQHRASARAWRAAALAAVVLLGLNLLLALQTASDSVRPGGPEAADIEAMVERIRQRDPQLPESEARQQALLVLAGAQVTARPDPATFQTRFFFVKDDAPWDTH
jgi:hypothetical protein